MLGPLFVLWQLMSVSNDDDDDEEEDCLIEHT